MYRGHGQCVEPRRTREREGEREKRRPRVPANPSPVIKRFGEQPVRKIVNESPWTVRPMTQLGRAIYLGQLDRTGIALTVCFYTPSKIYMVQDRNSIRSSRGLCYILWNSKRVQLEMNNLCFLDFLEEE